MTALDAAGRVGAPGGRERGPRTGPATLLLSAIVVGLVLAAQIPLALGLLQPDVLYEAANAKMAVAVNALLALATVAAAALLPPRLRALALAPGGATAAAMLSGAVTVGGHAWDFAVAGLTVMSAWWVGRALLRIPGTERLRGVFAIELTIGLGVVGLVVLALGRLDAIAWWSAGLAVLATGGAGAWIGAREGWSRRGAVLEAITDSPVTAACAGLLLLQLGWVTVWVSAPEIMFDSLFSKAYLSALWAHTGSIDPLLMHPQLNVMGLAQIVAAPGHTLRAEDVGRELQLLTWVVLTTTVWWWAGRRSAVGAFAALAVGVAPQLVWQATTAYDDLLLSLGTVGLALAVLRTIGARSQGEDASLGLALAIGLLAGSCIWLKLHLAVIVVVLAGGWVLTAGPLARLPRRLGGVGLGGIAIAGPAFALRWIDTGNPVFPTYNSIFESPHYPPIDEPYNFPFWPQSSFWDVLTLPYEAIVHPFLMSEAAPEGSFGLLVAAAVLGVLIGWRLPQRRAALIVWSAVVVGLLFWWLQFRYLRYAIPAAVVALLLVVPQLGGGRPGRAATGALLAAAGLASIVYLPSTIATFWNVPGRDLPFAAAFGRWSEEDYLRTVFPEKDALAAFERNAPRGANAISDAHARLFVLDRNLSPHWEVERLLSLSGPSPTRADDALRRLQALGIEWALVTGANRTAEGASWLPQLLAAHGEPVFADRGWDLYRLVERPARPRMLPDCDPGLQGDRGCWSGTLDTRPGLSDGESAGGIARSVPACAGQTVAVRVTTATVGQATQVALNSDSGDLKAGHNGGVVPAGRAGWVFGTAPPGTASMTVTVVPGIGGGHVEQAQIGLLGRCGDTQP